MHAELIHQYSIGGEQLHNAIAGLTRDDLLQRPAADAQAGIGKWSIHEVVIHLQDAETALADRVRRIIAEENPILQPWNETAFAAELFYTEQSAELAAQLIDGTRRQLSHVLRKLPPAAFARAGMHTERGRQTLSEVLNFAVEHLEHHLKFIVVKREAFGKIMW